MPVSWGRRIPSPPELASASTRARPSHRNGPDGVRWVWRHPTPPGLLSYIGISRLGGTGTERRYLWAERSMRAAPNGRSGRVGGPTASGSLGAVKDIGLVGVPFSGRSTLFTALTRAGSHGGQANVAVVPVPDPRLDVLTEMERSKKTVAAQVRFVDVPGGTSSAQGVAKLREADALALVIRCFGPDRAPAAELAGVRADLLLADLGVIESALEKAEKRAKGRVNEEVAALRNAKAALDAETPLRAAGLEPREAELLRGIAPLTMKPEVVVANLEEGLEVPAELASEDAVGVYASIEAETAEMDPEEARALLEEFGVAEPGLEKVIHAGYRALDLITFLTTGEDETRAWEVRRGAHAPEAAGVIHTDLQRGFIRADVISYDDLVAQGSMEDAKTHGKVRVEGKDYQVQEGDILHVRFAV